MARIVAVDDDADILDLVALKLELEGHKVFTARDGQAALVACLEHTPHLMVMDISMPVMSGDDALWHLRRNPKYGHLRAIPVVLQTARAGTEDKEAVMDDGADAYVIKPFSPRDLAAVIDDLLSRSGP